MAQQKKHPVLRVLVPVLILAGGIALAIAVARNTGKPAPVPPPGAPAPTANAPSTLPPPAAQPAAITGDEPPTPPQPEPQELTGLRLREFDGPAGGFASIGSVSEPNRMALVEFSPVGAGIKAITLAGFYETIERKADQHVVLQHERQAEYVQVERDAAGNPILGPSGRATVLRRYTTVVTPMAAAAAEINGVTVDLSGLSGGSTTAAHVWRQTGPGAFEAEVVDEGGTAVARITREYSLKPGLHAVEVRQRVHNLTASPMTVRWWQFGPVDVPKDLSATGLDVRRVKFGYLSRPQVDPSRQFVQTNGYQTLPRSTVVGSPDGLGLHQSGDLEWPTTRSTEHAQSLVFTGLANRYFAAAVHPLIDPALPAPDKVLHAGQTVYSVVLDPASPDPLLALQTRSEELTAAPGGFADVSMGLYAGPLSRPEIRRDPAGEALGLPGLVVYNLGGMCGWCTFPLLTGLLLALLNFLHDYLVYDWALGILLLVVVVRTVLHPVTKWSQIRMSRFGKQMQGMGPKQKKLQEKYKDDPKRLREETAKLWREEGISPTGALGCLPMFLQTPVWIALYATLFFAVELRHEPAFFGVFQSIRPGHPSFLGWFLGDLSAPDRFFYFGRTLFTIPLIGPVDSINILPLVLAVVFFVQQKYLTPPSSVPLSPEQEQTQKITKIMMVVLFPVMMYGQASGLALYFICNSTLGILETKYIRGHMDKYDKPPDPKAPRKPGFLARLQAAAEERRKQLERKGYQGKRKR